MLLLEPAVGQGNSIRASDGRRRQLAVPEGRTTIAQCLSTGPSATVNQSQPGRQKRTCGPVVPPGLTSVAPPAQCSSTGLFSIVPPGRIPERKPVLEESEI